MNPLLEVDDVHFSFDEAPVLRGVSFELRTGELLGVIGPNGAGKTTLLRVLLGILAPTAGAVRCQGNDIRQFSRREMALRFAFTPQDRDPTFGFPAREMVAMGRTPYVGRFRPLDADDRAAIDDAMAVTDSTAFADRSVAELSGGERQRVVLARSFAQTTPILVLDEPTANLDLFHELRILELLRQQTREGTSAIAVLHDLNLAARHCDRLLVMSAGRSVACGAPEATLTPELLRDVFRVEASVGKFPGADHWQICVLGRAGADGPKP